jgi:flagellar hook-associated protein 1 FlgK
MSTFSGLNGALTSLLAQRRALEIAGQNIANVNTPGYTRQRAHLTAIDGASYPSLHAGTANVNGGVALTSVERLGEVFLEARVREEAVNAGYLGAVAEAWDGIEALVQEPGDDGLAAQMDGFFTAWQDVANRPDDLGARALLLQGAEALVTRIGSVYREVAARWADSRGQAGALEAEVNTTADAVADLNARIRSVTVSGGNANTLVDERANLLTRLAQLVGAEARPREDDTVDVMVGGNALVRGDDVHHVAVQGAPTLAALVGWDPAAPATPAQGPVRLVWSESGTTVGATGGRLGGLLTALAPAGTTGPGGPLATIAATLDDLATELATRVNTVHATGLHLDADPSAPDPDTDFFAVSTDPADGPPALNLHVAVSDVRRIRAAAPGAGALDGSVADAVSQLADVLGQSWSQTVVNIGVQTRTAGARAASAAATFDVATDLLQARTGVNLDEETLALMASQRAYEGAARVVTAIDQLLDTLINRTGIVGR